MILAAKVPAPEDFWARQPTTCPCRKFRNRFAYRWHLEAADDVDLPRQSGNGSDSVSCPVRLFLAPFRLFPAESGLPPPWRCDRHIQRVSCFPTMILGQESNAVGTESAGVKMAQPVFPDCAMFFCLLDWAVGVKSNHPSLGSVERSSMSAIPA